MNWNEKEILISGGTGSLGKTLTKLLLKNYNPKGIRIFSRDELKQWEMKQEIKDWYIKYHDSDWSYPPEMPPISYLVGDIRDRKRIELASKGVDILIHTAALKQVPSCENNPLEAIQTNIVGSQNILYAALENKIEKAMIISSDKAVMPINLYGATKLCMEKLFIQGNTYSGNRAPHFSVCRYGNVIGSRGSVIPLFKKQAERGVLTITHRDMTRFWIRLNQVAEFILKAIDVMEGGEIFIPKMPSAKVFDVAVGIIRNQSSPETFVEIKKIGIRPGEKLHEILITGEEMKMAAFNQDLNCFVIANKYSMNNESGSEAEPYTSNTNLVWLTDEEIDQIIREEI
ncbi:MAG: polysaccharide biosynthesis protein [Gammaproteobacteria bacterium]|nr:polysaccharide biosynthesis protein [Gammaproteobacteria bacterium]